MTCVIERTIMSKFTKNDIYKLVDEEDVEFIRLQFCDILGKPKNLAITVSQLDRILNNEVEFDATPAAGFEACKGLVSLHPDLDTFQTYPWRPQTGKVARMYCDVYCSDGKPFEGDSRRVLRRVMQEADKMGLTFDIRPDQEFFLFHTDDDGKPTTLTHEYAGCFDVAPLDLAENVRRDIILTLEEMDMEVIQSHHEISPAQHEIDIAEGRADRVADQVMTFRMVVKTISQKHGLYATFMPKPLENRNGSAFSLHIVCRDALGKNLFADDGQEPLSEMGKQFLAGVLAHMKGITLLTNPIVNSYKRLIPGFDAPTRISWSDDLADKKSVVHLQREGNSTEIELRNPDGVCNPYLAFAVILAAGMDGIKKKMQLSPKAELDDSAEHEMLPESINEAIDAYEEDPLIHEVLGDTIYTNYLNEKLREWKEFRSVVTNWELKKYLGIY